MAFYEPTTLFRHNAIRRSEGSACIAGNSSCDTLTTTILSNLNSSRLLNLDPSDMPAVSKACGLDRINIKLNYWRIPDASMNLTAIAASNSYLDVPLMAIASGATENNLFVYELDTLDHNLTHHSTILLPNIHGLAWMPGHSNYLVAGNTKGYAHVVMLPVPEHHLTTASTVLGAGSMASGAGAGDAEIVARLNHRKHLRAVNKDPSIHSHASSCVSRLGFADAASLVSLYDDTVFVWDMQRCTAKPRPTSVAVVPGVANFDARACDASTLALAGSFGVSLFDTRSHVHSVPSVGSSNQKGKGNGGAASIVTWHGANEHVLAAAHADGVVRLWDVRKEAPFAELAGHNNRPVTAVQWNHNDLFTGGSDGSIVHWDLTTDVDDLVLDPTVASCSLRDGLASVDFDRVRNSLVDSLLERQCGTRLPALNNRIVGMCLLRGSDGHTRRADCQVVTIDAAALLGLHLKIYDVVDGADDFYTASDVALMQSSTGSTLVEPCEPLHKRANSIEKVGDYNSTGQNNKDQGLVDNLHGSGALPRPSTGLQRADSTSTLCSKDFIADLAVSPLKARRTVLATCPLSITRKPSAKLPRLPSKEVTRSASSTSSVSVTSVRDIEDLAIHKAPASADISKRPGSRLPTSLPFMVSKDLPVPKDLLLSNGLPVPTLLPSTSLMHSLASALPTSDRSLSSFVSLKHSICTVSTGATEIEADHRKSILFSFLDAELDRIRADFQEHLAQLAV